jgi:putative FmdB family regulatory protein
VQWWNSARRNRPGGGSISGIERRRNPLAAVFLSADGARIFSEKSEACMPVYDYVCNDCHKTFELVLTLEEHEHEPKCPHCGSTDVMQEAAAFFAVTPRKS